MLTATAVSVILYYRQTLLLLLKVGQVFNGVFDTSVPAFPLAGMLFVLVFIVLRRTEFEALVAKPSKNWKITALGITMAVVPLLPVAFANSAISGSYVFAAAALATCWVGVISAIRPSAFHFLWSYLVLYVAAIGSVAILTTAFGDPLAIVVAAISNAIASALGLPAHWTSVNITFVASGGGQVDLYISQECSGVASISIFLLLMGLMYLDIHPRAGITLAVAVGGALLFLLLNAARVVVLIAAGVYGGQDLLWNLHGWVGYVFYVMGYTALLLVFTRLSRTGASARATTAK